MGRDISTNKLNLIEFGINMNKLIEFRLLAQETTLLSIEVAAQNVVRVALVGLERDHRRQVQLYLR
jgi:hypothetical protein